MNRCNRCVPSWRPIHCGKTGDRGASRGRVAGCYPLPANWRSLVLPWYWQLFWESCNGATMLFRQGTLHASSVRIDGTGLWIRRDLTAVPHDCAARYRCGGEQPEPLQPTLIYRPRDRVSRRRRAVVAFATAALSGSDGPGLAVDRASLGAGRLALRGGIEAPDLIGHADQEHGLASVLQQINDARGSFFQVD